MRFKQFLKEKWMDTAKISRFVVEIFIDPTSAEIRDVMKNANKYPSAKMLYDAKKDIFYLWSEWRFEHAYMIHYLKLQSKNVMHIAIHSRKIEYFKILDDDLKTKEDLPELFAKFEKKAIPKLKKQLPGYKVFDNS